MVTGLGGEAWEGRHEGVGDVRNYFQGWVGGEGGVWSGVSGGIDEREVCVCMCTCVEADVGGLWCMLRGNSMHGFLHRTVAGQLHSVVVC